jgi:hypothetical protein
MIQLGVFRFGPLSVSFAVSVTGKNGSDVEVTVEGFLKATKTK